MKDELVRGVGRLCLHLYFGRNAKRIIAGFEADKGFSDIEKLKKVAEVLSVPLEVTKSVIEKLSKNMEFFRKESYD